MKKMCLITLLTVSVAACGSSGTSPTVENPSKLDDLKSTGDVTLNPDGTFVVTPTSGGEINVDPSTLATTPSYIQSANGEYFGVSNDSYVAVAGKTNNANPAGTSGIRTTAAEADSVDAQPDPSKPEDGFFTILSGSRTAVSEIDNLTSVVKYDGSMSWKGKYTEDRVQFDANGNPVDTYSGQDIHQYDVGLEYQVDPNKGEVNAYVTSLDGEGRYENSTGESATYTETYDGQTSVYAEIEYDQNGNVTDTYEETDVVGDEDFPDFDERPLYLGKIEGNSFGGENVDFFKNLINSDNNPNVPSYTSNITVDGSFFGQGGQYLAGTIVGTDVSTSTYSDFVSTDRGEFFGVFTGEKQ